MIEEFPYRVRDPIHGFILFSDREKAIIDKPQLQRLKNIKQLAMTYYVYPGAMHSRFEHSLGVMELATRIFDKLLLKHGKLIDNNFKEIELDIEKARQILRLTALLHDVGHLPFSHGGEVVLPKGKKHEDVSIAIIGSLEKDIDTLYFHGMAKIVSQILEGQVIPQLNFIKNILSGSIDADRMDYLARDSHHCGVNYGSFDQHRLIETLTIIADGKGGLELAIDHGGIHIVEALILARYYMFTQVYMHRTRRIYDIYLRQFMEFWKPNLDPLTNVLDYDDINLINNLRNCASDSDCPVTDLAKRICFRRHHSVVYETSEFADARAVRKAKEVFKALISEFPQYDFIIDDTAKGPIHKFFVSGDYYEGEELVVIHKQRRSLITEESSILGTITRQFNIVRIYANEKDQDQLNYVRHRAKILEEEVK